MTPQKGQRLGGRGKPPEPTSTRTDPPAPTAPETPEETPVDSGRPVRPVAVPPPRVIAEVPAEMDKDARDRWQWQLRATAGKAVAARRRADEATRAWERLVTQARSVGVPERLIMATALDADVDLPPGE